MGDYKCGDNMQMYKIQVCINAELCSSLVHSERTFYDLDLGAACLVAFCKKRLPGFV